MLIFMDLWRPMKFPRAYTHQQMFSPIGGLSLHATSNSMKNTRKDLSAEQIDRRLSGDRRGLYSSIVKSLFNLSTLGRSGNNAPKTFFCGKYFNGKRACYVLKVK